MNRIKLGVECASTAILPTIVTNADVFWLHLEDDAHTAKVRKLVEEFTYTDNLRLVMTSGNISEELHDSFDELFEDHADQGGIILTVWSEDSFSETLWEFVNVHAARSEVGLAKVLIISESISSQMRLLTEISAIAWAE
jgi:hypothetical protein